MHCQIKNPDWRGRKIAVDRRARVGYHGHMFETICLLFGLAFSMLVYVRSIRAVNEPPMKKAFYFLFSFIGITGTLFLFGILVAHKMRAVNIP